MFRVTVLAAMHGDSIWIEWGDAAKPFVAIFDSGPPKSTAVLKERLERLQEQERTVRLLVVSHIDDDHIGGILELLDGGLDIKLFDEIWFNGRSHLASGVRERFAIADGRALQTRLDGYAPWNKSFQRGAVKITDDGPLPTVTIDGLEITVLSPSGPKLLPLAEAWDREVAAEVAEGTKDGQSNTAADNAPPGKTGGRERFGASAKPSASSPIDRSIPNGSSIALHLQYEGKHVVLTGDAHPGIVVNSLKRLGLPAGSRYDLVQLPHHGSSSNVTSRFLSAAPAWNYFVSSDGSKHNHPHVRSLERMAVNKACEHSKIWFNHAGIAHIDAWFAGASAGGLKQADKADSDGVAITL
ncbi:ComEC/Rec2 family competence protein [Burkholderia cepacia]|uniref:ComEC/Rec2 family competence protein n=1 Tax=Burkholderia cepacia TaxID=292 RepID=UPI0009C04493|nr:MBL fold metallo-hydrolase [Burkholderia cepacia]